MPAPIIQGTKHSTITLSYISKAAKKNSMSRNRPSKYKTKNSDAVHLFLNHIVLTLEASRTNNNGKIPYGFLRKIVDENKLLCPWITRDMVKHHLKKHHKTGVEASGDAPPANQAFAASSSTTYYSAGGVGGSPTSLTSPTAPSSTTAGSPGSSDPQVLTPPDQNDTEKENVGYGRPKGTTSLSSRETRSRIRLATTEASIEYKSIRDSAHAENKKAPRGALTKILELAKEKHHVKNARISKATIVTRVRRNKLDPISRGGTPSPMLAIEPHIVELVSQLARLRCPINVTTGLQLANSIIAGTQYETNLIAWKQRHCVFARKKLTRGDGNKDKDDTSAKKDDHLLGWGYWRNFMKRNGHLIKSKKAVKFDFKRAEWCTYRNFKVMYDEIYKEMEKGGIAARIEGEDGVFLDGEGKQLKDDEADAAMGLRTKYLMQRPDRLVFVDEVGSNTSTTKDGNVGGEKYLCAANSRPQACAATKDSHFTVLGFTTATGHPLMCAIIFAAKELEYSWALGFDANAKWSGDHKDLRLNAGELGKPFPMGPSCTLNGVEVPTFCCCSENGSITADLLTDMLKTIDGLGVFDRSDGVPPFLLLDGHGSRFDLTFLTYINNIDTKWNVCIGVPYGTSYWQVGDSTEQNGCFKMALTKFKRQLLVEKSERRQTFAIDKIDIALLVHKAWNQSFARVHTNRKAIASRGWNPLNYNCLLHPEILSSKPSYDSSQSTRMVSNPAMNQNQQAITDTIASPPSELNLTEGLAGTLIDKILQTRNRSDARNGVNLEEQHRKQVQSALDAIKAGKRVTAGLHVAAGRFSLNGNLLDDISAKQTEREEKLCEKRNKKIQEHQALKNKVAAIRELGKTNNELNVAQLRTMVSWFKQPQDLPMPTTRQLLVTRLNEVCHRNEPHKPLHLFPHAAPIVRDAGTELNRR